MAVLLGCWAVAWLGCTLTSFHPAAIGTNSSRKTAASCPAAWFGCERRILTSVGLWSPVCKWQAGKIGEGGQQKGRGGGGLGCAAGAFACALPSRLISAVKCADIGGLALPKLSRTVNSHETA